LTNYFKKDGQSRKVAYEIRYYSRKKSCIFTGHSGKKVQMKIKISSLLSLVAVAFVCTPTLTQAQYQTQNDNYGVSGGNVNDISRAFCCSGTLGSLLTAGGGFYILSNNHVLARQDQAAPGEDISQPGLIDNSCQPPRIVADFSAAPPLGSNVDAAVAALRSSTMNTTGAIQGLNGSNTGVQPSTTTMSPAVGMAVQKSGRTTGHTTGTIGSINTSVNVQYQIQCGKGRKYTVSYTNQVVINSSSFSAGGDSGSLILTNTTCAHPVALLFAGSSSTTIGNRISDVLSALAGVGYSASFVGQNCTGPSSPQSGAQSFQLPQQALDRASRVLEQNRHDLMSRPAVLGVGLGALEDNSAPAVVVYVDKTSTAQPQLPAEVDNVPVRIIMTDPFVAF
jgi:hypothetical protein